MNINIYIVSTVYNLALSLHCLTEQEENNSIPGGKNNVFFIKGNPYSALENSTLYILKEMKQQY